MASSKAYVSREERKIPVDDPTGKWSDLTLMPEWAEKYYDVYTVRKHGKWVMLKALKPEYAGKEEMRDMLSREFDTRYNLSHPNIVMVNDFEEVPGVGPAIITDDVYGYSLRRLIDEKRLTPLIVHRLHTQLLDAMQYIQDNRIVHHPITPETIIFTEYNENLKLIDVGFDQEAKVSGTESRADIASWGRVMNEVLDHLPANLPRMRRIANRAASGDKSLASVADLQLAVERRTSAQLYWLIISFIIVMAMLLWFLKD